MGIVAVLIESALPIASDRVAVAVWCVGFVLSVACTVTEKAPAAVGVPLMTPFAASERPPGRAPAERLQV